MLINAIIYDEEIVSDGAKAAEVRTERQKLGVLCYVYIYVVKQCCR